MNGIKKLNALGRYVGLLGVPARRLAAALSARTPRVDDHAAGVPASIAYAKVTQDGYLRQTF